MKRNAGLSRHGAINTLTNLYELVSFQVFNFLLFLSCSEWLFGLGQEEEGGEDVRHGPRGRHLPQDTGIVSLEEGEDVHHGPRGRHPPQDS